MKFFLMKNRISRILNIDYLSINNLPKNEKQIDKKIV